MTALYLDHNVVTSAALSPASRGVAQLLLADHSLRARCTVIVSDTHMQETLVAVTASTDSSLRAQRRALRRKVAETYLRLIQSGPWQARFSWLETAREYAEDLERRRPGAVALDLVRKLVQAAEQNIVDGFLGMTGNADYSDPDLEAEVLRKREETRLAQAAYGVPSFARDAYAILGTNEAWQTVDAVHALVGGEPTQAVTALASATARTGTERRPRVERAQAALLAADRREALVLEQARSETLGCLEQLVCTLRAHYVPAHACIHVVRTSQGWLEVPSDADLGAALTDGVRALPLEELPRSAVVAARVAAAQVEATLRVRGGRAPLPSNVMDALHAANAVDANFVVSSDEAFREAFCAATRDLEWRLPTVLSPSDTLRLLVAA